MLKLANKQLDRKCFAQRRLLAETSEPRRVAPPSSCRAAAARDLPGRRLEIQRLYALEVVPTFVDRLEALIERNLILPFGPKLRRPPRFMIGDMLRHFKVTAVLQVGRNAGPNVPFPSPELFALGAWPKDRASFDLWIAPSTSARLAEAPTLTCAPQAA